MNSLHKSALIFSAALLAAATLAACDPGGGQQNAPVASPKPCLKTITPATSAEVPEVKPVENGPVPPLSSGTAFGQEPNIAAGQGNPPQDFIRKTLIQGDGSEVSSDADVVVNYKGQKWNGEVFDSSWKHGQPASFNLKHVVDGWHWGLAGAHVGDRIELVIPPKLGYGELTAEQQAQKAAGNGPADKNELAGETLVFVVDIIFSPPVVDEKQLEVYTQLLSKSRPTSEKLPEGLKIFCNPGEEPQPAYVAESKVPEQPSSTWILKGQGKEIKAGDQIGYVVVYGSWGDKPDSTWSNGAGVTWADAVEAQAVGKTVGSRLVMVGPPTEKAKRGVIQIVDIVDAVAVPHR